MCNKGDIVLDPFGGLMTVPMIAVEEERYGMGIELNPGYFFDGVSYCRAAESKIAMPTLFDITEKEEADA
jgi:DNA modification methylase